MPSLKEIRAANALINDATAPRVSVWVGGTSGVGKLTIKALVETGASVKIYVVGRKSSEERTKTFTQELNAINPKAEFIWVEGEVSLLAETKRVCEIIKEKESYIDLLFLSTGYAPLGTREETSEGLEICQSLEYYTRILFTLHLLPLLQKAESPRVVSVLGGGLERFSVNTDDIDLKKPGSFSSARGQVQYGHLNSIGLDWLANEYPDVTFMHTWPGWVDTGNVRRGNIDPNSWMGWLIWLVLEPLIKTFSMRDEDSAQRNLFQCTSAAFGGRGVPWKGKPGLSTLQKPDGGLFLVNYRGDCTPNTKNITRLRENAQPKVWAHTQNILEPYL
ncbi:unnamed protein product [Clonostachys chloroleuca]|uniref:Uncharacterized protein n=1 Tax=Clonostachys chloroleuca TaxID=1926264 RepID=A0AA35Q4L0_9HYPO|nr:unnamed protein product [Clonostachys chloroleuca]